MACSAFLEMNGRKLEECECPLHCSLSAVITGNIPSNYRRTEDTLGELLKEIETHSATVRFEAMANIIAVHSQSEGRDIHDV